MQPLDCIKMVVTMNPCKCGYFPDYNRCSCSPNEVRNYMGRVSRPLLDRIDLCAEMQEISFGELSGGKVQESSAQVREQVTRARSIQLERYRGTSIQFNSQLDIEGLQKFCVIGKEEHAFMEQVYHKLDLTARSYHRILKVARTIADLEGASDIAQEHLSEAVCYRMADKKFWTR